MKVTVKMFLHFRSTSHNGPQWDLWGCNMSDTFDDTVCIGERAIEVDVPDNFDPRPGMIDSLRKQRNQVRADAQRKVTQIEERIQQLLCLEYRPEAKSAQGPA